MIIKLINRRWYADGKFVGGIAFGNYCRRVKTKPSELNENQVREFILQLNPQLGVKNARL